MSDLVPTQAKALAEQHLATCKAELVEIEAFEINSQEDSTFAAEMLRDIKARYNLLEGKRTEITGPINKGLRAVNALFKPPKDALLRAERILKKKIAGYIEEVARANVAALDAAAVAETPEEAKTALAEIEYTAPPKGVNVRYKYVASITNAGLVPDEFRMPDLDKIQAFTDASVKKKGEPTAIAGVRFDKIPIVSSRAVR